jgi:predicted permease
MSFQNSVFLALPIAYALFGENGVLNIIVFNIGLNLLYFTYGIWLITRSNPSAEAHPLSKLVNTATVALVLGAVMGGLCIKLPAFAFEGAKILGDATIPLATLFVGAMLAKGGFDRSRVNIKEMAVIVLGKLVVMPLLFLGILRFMGDMPQLMRSIIVLQACMPSASTSPIFVRQYGGDHDLAATSVFFTTLFSIVTVPFFMSLL